MKLKTSQPFWQNLLNRFLSIQLFIFLFLILSFKAEAKVGVLEALQAIAVNEDVQIRDLFKLSEKNVKIFDDLRSSDSLKIFHATTITIKKLNLLADCTKERENVSADRSREYCTR